MKKAFKIQSVILSLMFTLLLVTMIACGGMSFKVTIPRDVVEKQVVAKFPITRDKGLMTVTIDDVDLDFTKKPDRLTVLGKAKVAFLGLIPVEGDVVVNGKVKYRPQSGSFHFTDIQLEKFHLEELPESKLDEVSGVLGSVVVAALGGLKIYTLDPNDAKENLAKLVLHDVNVNNKGITVTLGLTKK